MKIITQCGFLFFVCLCGIALSRAFPFPMPASVLSMLVLFAMLLVKVIRPSFVQETTDFLLGNMAFFFIPSGVGILAHIETIRGNIVALFTICIATMCLTFAAAAFGVAATIELQRRIKRR